MADSTLKPNTGNDLVLSNDDGSAKIEVNEGADIVVTIGSSAGDDFNVGSGKLLVEGDSSLVSMTGDLKVGGNNIQDSSGSSALTFDGSANVSVDGTLSGNVTVGSGKTLTVSAGTLTTSTAQKQAIVDGADVEGTAVLSTGESGGTKFLREDGDGSCSWQTPSAVPTGMIAPMGMSSAPTGWLACDGSNVSRSTYSGLFSTIGTTWGAGDGSSTFGVPDLRGAFLRGTGTAGVSSDYVGPSVGAYQDDQNASHSHGGSVASVGNHSHSMTTSSHWQTNSGRVWYSDSRGGHNYGTGSAGSHSHGLTINSDGSTEARVYNRGVQYCIKF
nr:phage tail fiber protein [uncultured Mediterranean phage uvMED]